MLLMYMVISFFLFPQDVETIFCYLCGMQAVAGLPESSVRSVLSAYFKYSNFDTHTNNCVHVIFKGDNTKFGKALGLLQ